MQTVERKLFTHNPNTHSIEITASQVLLLLAQIIIIKQINTQRTGTWLWGHCTTGRMCICIYGKKL